MELNSTAAILLIAIVMLFTGLVGGQVNTLGFESRPFGALARTLVFVGGLVLGYFSLDRLNYIPADFGPDRLLAKVQGRPTITITDSLARYQTRESIDLILDGKLVATLVIDRDRGVLTDSVVVPTTGKPIHYRLKGVELDHRDGPAKTRIVSGEGFIRPVPGGLYEFQPRRFTETEVVQYIRETPR